MAVLGLARVRLLALAAVQVGVIAVAACGGDRAGLDVPQGRAGPGARVPTSGSEVSSAEGGAEQAPAERGARKHVVVYASVDQNYSEPVLEQFEARTGIEVKAVYDVEAAKTTGLVNRLLAEKDNPRADVWWSGEFAQTVELADEGVLAPYRSPSASAIPDGFRSQDDLWTGFGGRARVLLANVEELAPHEIPVSIFDLVDAPIRPQNIGIANPVFGTSATHAAALYALLGPDEGRAYFESLRDRGVHVLDGNAAVRDQVASGQLAFGLTDTDDACGAMRRGAPVKVVLPDQGQGSIGTLVVPNTVALVKGAPHSAEARALIDYLLSEETSRDLMASGWLQLLLRPIDAQGDCALADDVRVMDVGLEEIAAQIGRVKREMAEVFVH